MPIGEMHDERRGPVWGRRAAAHRYGRRRPVLGAVLIAFGIPATVAGFAMLAIYGENMVLDGLPAGALCFSGVIAFTVGLLMLRPGERLPDLREGYAEPDPAVRRTLLSYGIGAPLVGFGLSAIVCARLLAVALGGAAPGLLAGTIFIAGIVGVFAGGNMLVAKLPGLSPRNTREVEESRSALHTRRPVSVPAIPSERSPHIAGIVIAALALLLLVVFSWAPRTYGLDSRSGWIALSLVGTFVVGLLTMLWPSDQRPGHAVYEARFSSRIAGSMMVIGVALIPVVSMLATSGNSDPDTRWSIAIVFLIFGIVLAAIGGWLLKDRRIVLRADEQGLFWRKLGTIPWKDVVRARIQIGRRVCNVVVTIREPDGISLSFVVDLMGLDRTTGELEAALQKWGVPLR